MQALNIVLRAGAVSPQIADNQPCISSGWKPISREIHVVVHAPDNRLPFASLLTFRPLGFVMTQQLSTSLFGLNAVLRMMLSVDNSRGLTFYLPKQQPVRNLYTL